MVMSYVSKAIELPNLLTTPFVIHTKKENYFISDRTALINFTYAEYILIHSEIGSHDATIGERRHN